MDVNKALALTEWLNLFGDLVGLPHVRELGEFVSGQHLSTVFTFMKEKALPKEPSEKILNRREFFENLLDHLMKLESVSPNKYYSELKATAAGYGQSDEIAKFLAIILYEIRMNDDLQTAAFDVILPKLTERSRMELAELMDYLDDSSQWLSSSNWTAIIRKQPLENENILAGIHPPTPCTPLNFRTPLRDPTKSITGRLCAAYTGNSDVSVLRDSPNLREHRQRRRIEEQQNEIKRLKSEMNEIRHELDHARHTKTEFKREYEQLLNHNEKLLNSLREKESEKNVMQDKLEATELKLTFLRERKEESDDKVKEYRQLLMKNSELRGELDKAEESNMKLIATNQDLEDQLMKISWKVGQLERELSDAKEEAAVARDKSVRLEQTLKERDIAIKSTRIQLANEQKEHEECRNKLQNLIFDTEESSRLMEQENLGLALMKEEGSKYMQRIDALEAKVLPKVDEAAERDAKLRAQNQSLEDEMSKILRRLRQLEHELAGVKEEKSVVSREKSFNLEQTMKERSALSWNITEVEGSVFQKYHLDIEDEDIWMQQSLTDGKIQSLSEPIGRDYRAHNGHFEGNFALTGRSVRCLPSRKMIRRPSASTSRRVRKPIRGLDLMADIIGQFEETLKELEAEAPLLHQKKVLENPGEETPHVDTQVSLIRSGDSILNTTSDAVQEGSISKLQSSSATESFDTSRIPTSVVSPISSHATSNFTTTSVNRGTAQGETSQVGCFFTIIDKDNQRKTINVVLHCADGEPTAVFINGREARFVQ
ncbi:hypothetical protein QR680_016722 [Steinernema hermaphroditum]|uniref:Uncharacterized protein n=1 Tax=Steinernema hermaphroditum TaxID=289476 RepID=A0AA39LMT4_9BILA|nr:hypothetical protein QR680_016722 [Steinernema hermaphroditum]